MYPDLPAEEAYERLWEAVVHICRLDEDDPVAAWEERMETLRVASGRLTERRFDRIHLHGPGTDLTVGLFPSSRWLAAGQETVDGIHHNPNVPSEEVFTTPDPSRVDGYVTATMPLELHGSVISGIRVEFEGGRAVKIDAEQGAGALRAAAAKDDGGSRLGEVALVDGHGRIGPLGTVFFDTLIDENAASHIALGNAYERGVEDEAEIARVNRSGIHVDFMIGSPSWTSTGSRATVIVCRCSAAATGSSGWRASTSASACSATGRSGPPSTGCSWTARTTSSVRRVIGCTSYARWCATRPKSEVPPAVGDPDHGFRSDPGRPRRRRRRRGDGRARPCW